jgi:hypothetical protein
MESKPEKEKKLRKRREKKEKETLIKSVNADIVALYSRTLDTLDQIMANAKINPGQGYLATMIFANLLNGGAYVGPTSDRPFLVGKQSKYYVDIGVQLTEEFPISGLNFFDLIGSLFAIVQGANESQIGKAIATEIYMNANVPRKFPKLLSDEAYAKIIVSAAYLIHQDIAKKGYENLKTFIEASNIPVKTITEFIEKETEQAAKASKALMSLKEAD